MRDTGQQASPRQLSMLLGIYEEMVESAHDGLLLIEDNCIIGCNPAACDLYGLPRDELIGSHPGILSPVSARWRSLGRQGQPLYGGRRTGAATAFSLATPAP